MHLKPLCLSAAMLLALPAEGAIAADYEHIMLMNTVRLPMMAGPGNTGALLSPDGTKILHIGMQETCLLELSDAGSWTPGHCEEFSRETRPRGPEDMLWSPDSERLLMPTYAEALQRFRDTDVRVFDPATFAIATVTEDGFDDAVIPPFEGTALWDIAPVWMNEATISFIRYQIPKADGTTRGGPVLMSVDVQSGEVEPLFKQLAPDGKIIYTLAVSADGQKYAYSLDDRAGVKNAGLYVIDHADDVPQRVLTGAEVGEALSGLAFSADGKYLLLLSPRNYDLDARIIDLETGAVVPVGEGKNVDGVAWSPTGHALAYIVEEGDDPDHQGGLYLSPAPGEPGTQLVRGRFMTPVCCGRLAFTWAANNTMLLGRIEDMDTVLYVTLGP